MNKIPQIRDKVPIKLDDRSIELRIFKDKTSVKKKEKMEFNPVLSS